MPNMIKHQRGEQDVQRAVFQHLAARRTPGTFARLRAMRALALVPARPHREFILALGRAESDSAASLLQALELLEGLLR